jgi:pyruvate/2-oxoglutarate dehydrogenase complex dihydrolipoamide dehydrogenase (E3) component
MSVDYDLVIIGASPAGVHAAIRAANLNARVVLVDQGMSVVSSDYLGDRILVEIGRTLTQVQRAEQLGIYPLSEPLAWQTMAWKQIEPWTEAVTAKLESSCSATVLSSYGIEVISGTGEFCRKPVAGFVVNGRLLRSRNYLLATGCRPTIPTIDGLDSVAYLTTATLRQHWHNQPRSGTWVILGGDPAGVELAQSLRRLGCQVTILVSEPSILPQADPEAAYLIQAQLEAEGVQILTQTAVTQVKQIQGNPWIQVGNQAIEADTLLLATGQQPKLDDLNLDAVAVRWNAGGIVVNKKLQTTNPRIYACFGQNGNTCVSHRAIQEADIALKNALFLPYFRLCDRPLAQVVYSEPQVAGIGLTEYQAVQRYGKDVMILRKSVNTLEQAQLQGDSTGFCKLILRRNGTLLGAHLVGAQASECIGAIALAMHHHLPIQALATLPFPTSTFSHILYRTAADYSHLRLAAHAWLPEFLQTCFGLRRSWGR